MKSGSAPARLAALSLAERQSGKPLACERSEWLPVEASTRRYARLHGLLHYPFARAVAMLFPKGTPPAEVARVAQATRLLAEAGLPVPAIHDADPAAGWILQEDLGDVTLALALQGGAAAGPLYARALALIDELQAVGSLPTSPRPPLDGARLATELEQFVRSGLGLADGAGPALAADLQRLVQACLEAPVVLCHRDYHARNLMLHEGRLRMLDHQDALAGPSTYDRVSLAYDPYVRLPDALRDELAGTGPHVAGVAVQRLCKAIGTYGDKGHEWRAWIAPAARQARRLIARDGLRLPVLDAALASRTIAAA